MLVTVWLEICTAPCPNQLFRDMVMSPDTCSVAMIAATRFCQAPFCPCQLWMYGVHSASCFHMMYMMGCFLCSWKDAGLTMAWLAWIFPDRLYDQGGPGSHVVVVRRHMLYVPNRLVVHWLDMNYFLVNARLRGWSVILQGWLFGQTFVEGPSSSMQGMPRQTHCRPRVAA